MMLAGWLARWPGRMLLDAEQRELDRLLPDLFGFHLLQVGAVAGSELGGGSRIAHRVVLDCLPGSDGPLTEPGVAGLCDPEYLPLANDTIDVVLLPHTLEFTPDPHHVLREVERVLVSGGHVVITGFNPASLFGLCRWPLSLGRRPPWNGRFLTLWRLRDWMQVLGFEVLEARCLVYRPLIRRLAASRRLGLIDRLGQWLLPAFGGNYVLLARKSAGAIIPLQGRLRRRPAMLPAAVTRATPGGPCTG